MRSLTITVVAASLLIFAGCATRSVPGLRADGNNAHFRGDYNRAVELHREVVQLAPGRAQYRYELGRSLLAAGMAGEAREQLAIAHDLEPANATYVTAYADALIATQDMDTLQRVLGGRARNSASVDDYLLLGEYLGRGGDPDGQEQALLSAADIAGRTTDSAQRALGRFYDQTNSPQAALRRWRMVLWFNLNDPEAGEALRKAGDVPGPTAVLVPLGRAGR